MAVHVRVVPYDSCWPELFRREAEAVGRILGSKMTAPIRSIFSARILKKISTGIWRCAITCAQTTGRRQPMERSSCSWRGSFRRIWKGIAKAKMHL